MEKSTRELEWFDIEIRTREVIHQQLEPVLAKAREDRESFVSLQSYCSKLEKRVKDLEVSVLGDQPQETVISNIYELCANIEGQRKKDCVKFDQDIENLHEKIKSLNFSIDKVYEEIICIHTNEKTTEEEFLKIRGIIDDNKNIVLQEISSLDLRFKELNQIYRDLAVKAEERSVLAMNKANTNTVEMGNYKREVENIRKYHLEVLTMVREVKATKLEESEYVHSMSKIESKFTEHSQQLGILKDDIYHRDRFIDKFIPLQTATMISDYMHNTLDLPYKKKLADFENTILQELNNLTISSLPLETRENRAQKILDNMKNLEDRKVKLLTDIKTKEEEIEPPTNKIRKKLLKDSAETSENKNNAPAENPYKNPGLTAAEVQSIVDSRQATVQNALIKIIQEDINAKQETNKNYFRALIQENNSLVNQVIQDFEENSKQYKKESSIINKEFIMFKNTIEEYKKSHKNLENSMIGLTKMVVCLVENAQIEQALEAQDEEDRHNMVQGYEKDLQSELVLSKPRGSPEPYSSAIPSSLGIQKKCLGCGNNNSLISGFRSTVVYKPTPLIYRNKKFDRPSLINFRGRMVKECWEEVSNAIPWKQEDMENLVIETYKHTKPPTAGIEEDANPLPILNLPSRNRSYNNRRIRANKISM